MFYNLKNKIKKGIIFLLSALQIGALSGCMNDNVSKEEYEESLKKIEQLENDINSLEEENSKLEKDNNSLEESIDKITKEKEELEKRNEQLEIENAGLKEDYLSVTFPINSNEPFNIDLANKIGISEEVLSDDYLKECINEYNNFINSFENGLYYIKYNDYVKNTVLISYLVNDECIGNIRVLDENKNSKWLYFSYYKDNVTFSNTFKITDNKIEMYSNNYSWVYEDIYYYVSYTNYNDSSYIEIDSFNPTSEDKNLFIQLYQDEDNKYTLNINNDYPNFDSNEPNYIGFEISEEDFQTLNNLILTYLENKQNENIINYCKDALFDIFEKYGKENELQKYINVISNDQRVRILK